MKKPTNRGDAQAFLEHAVSGNHGSECLLWPFSRSSKGYGTIKINGKMRRAHRIVCERVYGPPSDKRLEAAHACGVSSCVNPTHLRWATSKENNEDRILHGTLAIGERHWKAILTKPIVRSIKARVASGEKQKDVAKSFGISAQLVNKVITGYTWGHIN